MIASTLSRATSTTGALVVGGCVGVLLVCRTGLLPAFPAAVGLTVLAATDLATMRLPGHVMATTSNFMIMAGIADASRLHQVDRFLLATMAFAVVFICVGAVWAVTSGIGFGDVKLLAAASFVPAWINGAAVITLVALSSVVAASHVVFRRLNHPHEPMPGAIAFGPAVLVAWFLTTVMA